jgi:hypothetical protein
VVIPEGIGWLAECIQSVARCTLDVEHIIVDDASAYDLRPLHKEFPDVRWLHFDEQQGAAGARNAAALSASSEWLFCLDADDVLMDGGLEQLYAYRCLEGFVYAPLHTFSSGEPPRKMAYDAHYNQEKLRELTGPIGINGLFHRRVWKLLAGWTTGLPALEDLEFWIKMAEHGLCGVMVDVPCVAWRQHPNSVTSQLYASRERVDEARQAIRNRHPEFFSGGTTMGCRKCPGADSTGSAFAQTPVEEPDGKVALKYVGARQGSFYTPYGPTGTSYRVNGQGTWIFVAPEDVEFFTQLRVAGTPEYQARIEAPLPATPAEQEPVDLPDLPPSVYMPAIGVREARAIIAKEQDPIVLRVWRAQEQASESPRKMVLEAIEAKMESA